MEAEEACFLPLPPRSPNLHRVALVPSYSFGENELYDQHIFTPGGWVNRFQHWFQRLVHIYPCAFYGRGFTENSWGLLPYNRPITTVSESLFGLRPNTASHPRVSHRSRAVLAVGRAEQAGEVLQTGTGP